MKAVLVFVVIATAYADVPSVNSSLSESNVETGNSNSTDGAVVEGRRRHHLFGGFGPFHMLCEYSVRSN